MGAGDFNFLPAFSSDYKNSNPDITRLAIGILKFAMATPV